MTEYPQDNSTTASQPMVRLPFLVGRKECEACKIDLAASYYDKHLITKKHITNMKLAEEKKKEEERAITAIEMDEDGIKYEEVEPEMA
jgi:hypothetical protein